MDEKNWQDKLDDTLERIEAQSDDTTKQTGFAFNFREIVLTSLTKIETAMEQNDRDHKEIKESVAKIPAMELGLNNHLHTHDTFRKYVMYPLIVSVVLASLGILVKLVLSIVC